MYTYTIIDPKGTGYGKKDRECDTITFRGFTTYRPGALFIAIASVQGETELWALEYQVSDESVQVRPGALDELRRYYRDFRDLPTNPVIRRYLKKPNSHLI
jgi:hypothetical protein